MLWRLLFFLPVVSGGINGSYNSFRRQVGFCRMQSFDTVSRETSSSVPMFLDGRVSFGIGLSHTNMSTDGVFGCGRCLNVTAIENFYRFNPSLTRWSRRPHDPAEAFVAMVFDDCTDPVCTPGYLDFDIYSLDQPVFRGNPHGIRWDWIPCPILPHETIEYLLCIGDLCNRDGTMPDVVYQLSVAVRNSRLGIRSVILNGTELALENAWVYHGVFKLGNGFEIALTDEDGREHRETIRWEDGRRRAGYQGAVFFASTLQT